MNAVYMLTLRQLAGRWRILIMTVLACMPVLIATLMLRSDRAPSVADFEIAVLSAILTAAIIPLIVLAIGTVAFSNELEDRTLANLTLSPIPRWQIVLPKLLAAITVAAPFIAVSAFFTSYIAYLGDVRAVIAVTVSAVIAVMLYAAMFVWLGLVTTQAIGAGLLYIVIWEGFVSGFVSGARLLSIRYYGMAFMHGLDERRFADLEHLSLAAVAITASVVFAGFLLLTIRRLRRMDVP